MSTPLLESMIVPLSRDDAGALRIDQTRVLLEIAMRAWRAG